MLTGIPAIISPELLKALCEMGHTETLCIGDGNFPGHKYGKNVIHLDGHGVPEILDAILKLMPLDCYVEKPVTLMQVVAGDPVATPIWDTYKEVIAKYDDRGAECVENIDKWDFYDQVKDASVVIMTSEKALYANIILKKGVVVD